MALSDELYFPLSRSVTAWMHLLRSFAINIIFGIFQLCNYFPVDVKVQWPQSESLEFVEIAKE